MLLLRLRFPRDGVSGRMLLLLELGFLVDGRPSISAAVVRGSRYSTLGVRVMLAQALAANGA